MKSWAALWKATLTLGIWKIHTLCITKKETCITWQRCTVVRTVSSGRNLWSVTSCSIDLWQCRCTATVTQCYFILFYFILFEDEVVTSIHSISRFNMLDQTKLRSVAIFKIFNLQKIFNAPDVYKLLPYQLWQAHFPWSITRYIAHHEKKNTTQNNITLIQQR
jgi:hypothetical protein